MMQACYAYTRSHQVSQDVKNAWTRCRTRNQHLGVDSAGVQAVGCRGSREAVCQLCVEHHHGQL